jgi:hypothetical protein
MFTTNPEDLPHEDDEGYPLVECEACRNTTLDENTDVCRNPACPTNDIVREAIVMLEADMECQGCQQKPCICGGDDEEDYEVNPYTPSTCPICHEYESECLCEEG